MCIRIQERHAVFRNEQRRVTLTPMTGTKVIVNGNPVSQATELQHLVGLDSNLNYMMWLCDMLLKYTLYIYIYILSGSPHSGFQLYLPVHWLSIREMRGRLESLWLRLLPVWTGCSWGHPPGWAGVWITPHEGLLFFEGNSLNSLYYSSACV